MLSTGFQGYFSGSAEAGWPLRALIRPSPGIPQGASAREIEILENVVERQDREAEAI
jgi:hypothetical protein